MEFIRGNTTKQSLDVGVYRNRPRKNGKTTRVIDEAIQFLFKSYVIVVPPYSKLMRLKREKKTLAILNSFIDPDWKLGPNVQSNLMDRIISRIKIEHYNTYQKLSVDMKEGTIKLKNLNGYTFGK